MKDRSSQGSESDELGHYGETEFERWCASLRWVANRAGFDRRGFDFLVHMPFDALPGSTVLQRDLLARDEHHAVVQVKTTGKGKAPSASLTVLRYLTDHIGPAFILILEVDCNASPWELCKAHLVHLDHPWIEDVSRRLWGLDEKASSSKVLVTIPFDRAVPLSAPDAGSFQQTVRGLSLGDPTAYLKQKMKTKERAGRPERPFIANVTFQHESTMFSEVAEWSVGLRTKARLPIDAIQLFEERFGKRRALAPKRTSDQDHLAVEVQDSVGVDYGSPCIIEFLQANTSRRVVVAASIFCSRSRAPFLPERFQQVRITAPGLEILLRHNSEGGETFSGSSAKAGALVHAA